MNQKMNKSRKALATFYILFIAVVAMGASYLLLAMFLAVLNTL